MARDFQPLDWILPKTLTQLRGFLGLYNCYEEYVPKYAHKAWRLMKKLKVQGSRAKAISNLPLHWNDIEKQAFESLKEALKQSLSLFQVDPDDKFQRRTDASNEAIAQN